MPRPQLTPITLVYAGMHMRKGHRFNTERPCPNRVHAGQPDVFHYSCFDCGADCTAGAKAGPATSDTHRIRRCRECYIQHQQAEHVYTSAAIGLLETVTRYFTRAAAAALMIGALLIR